MEQYFAFVRQEFGSELLQNMVASEELQGAVSIKNELRTTDYGLRTTDYGLGIKHGLRYKTRTKHYELGIKYGLGYKTRTERYGLGLNTKKGSALNKFSHELLHNKNRSYL